MSESFADERLMNDTPNVEEVDPSCHYCEHVKVDLLQEPCASCMCWSNFELQPHH